MSAGREWSVQRLRGGFVIVWWERGKRRRQRLESTDRQSAEAEARRKWQDSDDTPWTVGRIMTGYLATIAHKPSHARRRDAWKAMRGFWENVDPALIDEPMCKAYRLRRHVADATARYELLQLSTALKWAYNGHRIERRPVIWLPATPEGKIRHLDREQFARFFAEVKADHARL